MYVPQQGDEVVHVIAGFTFKPFLEQVAYALVLLVIVEHIAAGQTLDDLGDLPVALTDEQVEVVGHKAPRIEATGTDGQERALLVVLERQFVEYLDKPLAVFVIIEDVAAVHAAHHDVINSCARGTTCLSGH